MNKENSVNFTKRLFGFSIGPIINALIGFISVPLTTWLLFPEELGKASMYNTAIMVISSFIYLGLTNSHGREYHHEDNKSKLLLNCIIIPLTLSILISVSVLIFKDQISLLLFNEVSLSPLLLFSISIPIRVIDRFAASVIRMEEKAKLFSLHQIMVKVSNFLILVFVFVFIKKTYHAVIYASVGSTLIVTLSQVYFMRDIWKGITKSSIDKELISKLLKFGLPFVPAAALSWLFNSFDKMALRTFSDFTEIGIYSGAFKIIALLNIIKTSFNSFWSPTSYRWFENNEKLDKFQKVSNHLMSLFVTLASFAILFKYFIFKLLSDKYLPSASVFPFLMFIPILHTVSSTTSMGIQFMRKTHYQIYVFLIACIINVSGNLILVPKLGAVGAAISTGISYIVFFYVRSLFSGMLWKHINLFYHNINILLLLSLATVSSLDLVPIYIEVLITIFIIIFNLKNNIYVLKNIKKLFTKN